MASVEYGSIPSNDGDGNDNLRAVTGGNAKRNHKWTAIFAILSIAVVGVFAVTAFMKSDEDIIAFTKSEEEDEPDEYWPNYLVSKFGINAKRPTNTAEAVELGWEKSGEVCVPSLGEPWLFGGERGIDTSATLYFTPSLVDGDEDEVPGVLSGIEVDYYGYIETSLVGSYFSEEKTSKDGTYHSLAVALRNSADQDLCDANAARKQKEKYLAISPNLVNKLVPLKDSSSELTNDWKKGSCIPGMGYHWLQDTKGGSTLSYTAESTVPIVPMYDSEDGTLNAIFFLATSKKQIWQDDCMSSGEAFQACAGATNFWDPGPGLSQANTGPFYVCSNVCGKCDFSGSGSDPGVYTTMHWLFKDPKTTTCPGSDKGPGPYCPSNSYPKDFEL